MADNSSKRAIVNRALAILNAGRTAQAGLFFTALDDTQFADWTTISETDYPDARLAVMLYEPVLKQVIEDIQPGFAIRYADLGYPVSVNMEYGDWEYLFELPTDFLALVAQMVEGDPNAKAALDRDPEILHFKDYSHVVVGDDDQAYYCDTNHTSVDDTADGQPPDDDGDGNWTLYSTDGSLGETWYAGVAYKYNATGLFLATNTLTNADGTSAYIKYLAYVQTTSGGTAGRSDQPAYYPESFKNALATRLAAEMCLDSKDYERRLRLLEEYEAIAKPAYWQVANRHRDRIKKTTLLDARTSY